MYFYLDNHVAKGDNGHMIIRVEKSSTLITRIVRERTISLQLFLLRELIDF